MTQTSRPSRDASRQGKIIPDTYVLRRLSKKQEYAINNHHRNWWRGSFLTGVMRDPQSLRISKRRAEDILARIRTGEFEDWRYIKVGKTSAYWNKLFHLSLPNRFMTAFTKQDTYESRESKRRQAFVRAVISQIGSTIEVYENQPPGYTSRNVGELLMGTESYVASLIQDKTYRSVFRNLPTELRLTNFMLSYHNPEFYRKVIKDRRSPEPQITLEEIKAEHEKATTGLVDESAAISWLLQIREWLLFSFGA